MSPIADSDQQDGDQVHVANTGSDMGLWALVTGQEQATGGLSDIVDAADRNAGGEPMDSFEFKSHGWGNSQDVASGDGGRIEGNLTPEQAAEFERLGSMISEDGEIVMAGCNVAQDYVQHRDNGTSSLDDIAEASGRSVTAGTAIQLPFDGVEGSSVTVHPDGTYEYDTSSGKQVYDVTANGLAELGSEASDDKKSWSERASNVGSTLWEMGSDYFDIGSDVVNGTQNAEGWKDPGT